ncbi:hypothetical protein HXH85_14665 [Listeria monocytogenes]|nr:hypothetical protein [Listeria monocytogenes]NVW25808.1 hypothetical protein [Listeria monocytogenes]
MNKRLISRIQPQGGIKFKSGEGYFKTGDGYGASIYVHDYPHDNFNCWLTSLVNIQDAVSVLDISPAEKKDIIPILKKAMKEQGRAASGERDIGNQLDSSKSVQDMARMYMNINEAGEVICYLNSRIFVYAKTLQELEDRAKQVMEDLESRSFQGQVLLAEEQYEWNDLFDNYEQMQKHPNKRKGKQVEGATVAGGFQFHYNFLLDPTGSLLGITDSGGKVLFDYFLNDFKKRVYYNGVIIGDMRSGKSTTLKKLLLDNKQRGNNIRVFDVTGEFRPLVEKLNGKIIVLDGTEGHLNPFQVYRSNSEGNEEAVGKQAFTKHVSKMSMLFRYLAPDADGKTIREFENMLYDFYCYYGLIVKVDHPDGEEERIENKYLYAGITEKTPEEYPIFSDLLIFLRKEIYTDPLAKKEVRRVKDYLKENEQTKNILLDIEGIIVNSVNVYGSLFNHHTTIEDFSNEQVVAFSLRELVSYTSNIYSAQMYSILTLLWDDLIQTGTPMWKKWTNREIAFNDVTRTLILIDEAHRVINVDNIMLVKELTTFEREAPKYFAGLLFASQSIRDFVPENASEDDMSAIGEIIKLFELTQYKFIMKQDANAVNLLTKTFAGQLSENEVGSIPAFEKGDCILVIKGYKNIKMKIDLTPEQDALFGGGA